jgi:3-hydroxyacyl-[acyl-carrier-protein] dehydratase
MLLGHFFTIQSIKAEAGIINASLQINAAHEIFEGHFPGQPVVPGVCMVQLIKELVESVIAKKTTMAAAAEIKFLAVINPTENNIVQAAVKYSTDEQGNFTINASLVNDAVTHLKCRCLLILAD